MVLTKTASQSDVSVHSTFASRYVRHSLPRYKMPENSIPKEAAYQIINDELMLDGNPRLNLARIRADDRRKEGEKKAAAAEGGEKKADGGGKKEAGPMTVVLGAGKKDTGVAVSHGGGFKVEVKGKLKRRRQRWSEVVVEESMVREREREVLRWWSEVLD